MLGVVIRGGISGISEDTGGQHFALITFSLPRYRIGSGTERR